MKGKFFIITILALIILFMMTASIWATPVTFDIIGNTDPTLTARVGFAYDPTQGIVSIDITNTYSGTYSDPRITAFAFNVPMGVTGFDPSGSNFPSKWDGLFALNNIDAPQSLGSFDIAGVTKKDLSTGKHNPGIAMGETFNFSFVLTGTNFDQLTKESFLKEFSSVNNQGNGNGQFFAVRWDDTGVKGKDSDVGIPVPEPSTIILLGSGLIGLGLWGRRRLKQS